MQQNELTKEDMLAKIDELETKVDQLEWENKGIAEWQHEWSMMKDQRNAAKTAYAAREEEAHQLSEQIIKLTKERDELDAHVKILQGNNIARVASYGALILERESLRSAAVLALNAAEKFIEKVNLSQARSVETYRDLSTVVAALKEAGVQ